MQTWKANLLHEAKLILGEGAIRHSLWNEFLYVDIEGKIVGVIDPVSKKAIERSVGERVGTVVPAIDGSLIIALQSSIEELEFGNGVLTQLVKIEINKPANRCNDGKCDAAGRLWVGTMNIEAKPHEGALYCFDSSLQQKIEGVSIFNGICWSNDNATMYYIDSFGYDIKAYDFDLPTGDISNERIVVKIEGRNVMPNRMTIDSEGMLWVAMWGGACVHRYNPINGILIGKVQVDAPNVTACAFGGENMQQLFITTARAGLTNKQLRQSPLSGSLFIANTSIKGNFPHSFNSKKLVPKFQNPDRYII